MGRVVAGTLAGFLALVLVVAGGWKLHWWFAQSAADHNSHINRSSYGNQQTLRDEVARHLGDVADISTQIAENPTDTAQLKAQRLAIVNIVCNEANQITGDSLPSDEALFVETNCQYGNTKSSSIYAQK